MMSVTTKAVVSVLAFFPALALAHVGHDGGAHHVLSFTEGFLHPLTGVDHLIVMLLVGVWSAMNPRQWWLAPLVFALLLLSGALAGMAGFTLNGTEFIVATSLLGMGAMVALQMKLPGATGAMVIGAFAIFHGLTHGTELSHSLATLSGMVIATVGLHLTGLVIGWLMIHSSIRQGSARLVGGFATLIGIGVLSGII